MNVSLTLHHRRTLQSNEKAEYLNAVKCILSKPALTAPFENSGVKSRFDDLLYTHIQQTFSVHYVGHFLAWHRFFVATYETMLRDECGYKGAQPYWDWTLDTPAEKWASSPVFDPETGFGGNGPFVATEPGDWMDVPGRTGGGCVVDGPFAGINDIVHLGPGDSVTYNPQCLKRDLSPYFAGRYLAMNQTQLTLSQPDFGWFNTIMEGSTSFEASAVHGGGHYGVGGRFGTLSDPLDVSLKAEMTFINSLIDFPGQMGDLYASPADPIFYLHHANIDRVWWSWQKLDLEARLIDISGPIEMMDYNNAKAGNVTLDFPLTVGVSAADVTVGDVMNISGCGSTGALCYDYDEVYTLQA